jgi:hypothetical protein
VKEVPIGLVEEDSLLDNALIVHVQRQAASVVGAGAGAFETPCLDFERVVAAVPVGSDPLADAAVRSERFSPAGPRAS